MKLPLVSVLMPAYNAERYIDESIGSVLSQDFTDFELLIADDGSTDTTWERVRKHRKTDARIRAVRLRRGGVAHARNRLLSLARGKYIVCHDADDVMLPKRMSSQAGYLDARPRVDAVVGDGIVMNLSAKKPHLSVLKTPARVIRCRSFYSPPPHGAIMVRKNVLLRAGPYRPCFDGREDSEMWNRLIEFARVSYQPGYRYLYRFHADNVTNRLRDTYSKKEDDITLETARRRFGRKTSKLSFCVAGKTVAVETNSKPLADEIERFLRTNRPASRFGDFKFHIHQVPYLHGIFRMARFPKSKTPSSYYEDPSGSLYWRSKKHGFLAKMDPVDRTCTLYFKDFTRLGVRHVRMLLLYPLVRLTRAEGWYFLHSGCVERGGRTLLIVGPSGAGKSTVSTALTHRGFNFFSDETNVIFHRGGKIFAGAFPHMPEISSRALRTYPKLCAKLKGWTRVPRYRKTKWVAHRAGRYPSPASPCIVSALILPKFDNKTVFKASLMKTDEAADRILAEDYLWYARFGARAADLTDYTLLIRKLVKSVPVFECIYGKRGVGKLIDFSEDLMTREK